MGECQQLPAKAQATEWLAAALLHDADSGEQGSLCFRVSKIILRSEPRMGNKEQVKHGDMIRMEGWTDCAIHVADVGTYMIVGTLVDIKREQIIKPLFLASLDENWSIVKSAEDLIASL